MADKSNIEWTDSTFNPWEGCQKTGPGCDHCYAELRNARFGGGTAINFGPGAPRRRTSAANWNLPKRWNAQADAFMAQHGRRQRVFCASLADVFDNAVPREWRIDLFRLIRDTPNLDWLLLTKRIGNVVTMLADVRGLAEEYIDPFPWPNIWLGATIVNQAEADRDIPKLLAVPARGRFLSMEPLLGPVDLTSLRPQLFAAKANALSGVWKWDGGPRTTETPPLDWVIVGGESGPNARPMHPDWARSLRDQCEAAGTPFLFKQWGEWVDADNGPDDDTLYVGKPECWAHFEGGHHDGAMGVDFFNTYPMYRVGKKAAGRLLDGRTWDGFPAGSMPE